MIKKVIIEPYYALPCALKKFLIEDQEAYLDDFGSTRDIAKEKSEDYGCGNMQFFRGPITLELLHKYEISLAQCNYIMDLLEDKLAVGKCNWCV